MPNGVLAKITDFGIARMPGSAVKTMTGVILGSPRYMSPEQVIGKSIDHRSDIFSLGVVLYETLTGAAPFDGDNLTAIMYATINAHPAPPSTLNPAAPQMLDLIVAKALAKKVEDRYQGMREFASDLREVRRQLSGATGERPALAIDMLTPMRPAATVPPTIASGRLQVGAIEEEQATTLKLAKQFDSFAATMRLAALNQQTEEFREYISETQKMRAYAGNVETLAASAAVARATARPKSAPAYVPIPRGGHAATRLPGTNPAAVPSSSLIPVVVLGLLALAAVGLMIALLVR
jgi:eukaryotic-like serine/threonine-protein kinase